jgi:hypothetical protein
MRRSALWRTVAWIVGLAVTAVLGDIVGRFLAPRPDQIFLFKSIGSVIGVDNVQNLSHFQD